MIRVLTLTLAILLTGCEGLGSNDTSAPDSSSSLQQARVVRVVDGDTIIVEINGQEERLRYIGIDAPESVNPDAPVECFGPEAADENRRLVEGQPVFLESDNEDRDRFGRFLRYVYVAGAADQMIFVNLELVQDGFAEAGSYPPNERYSDELFAAERAARNAGRGLWGACS